jgi:hypothetical protein
VPGVARYPNLVDWQSIYPSCLDAQRRSAPRARLPLALLAPAWRLRPCAELPQQGPRDVGGHSAAERSVSE